jgi:opacity protein-like surface antigen
MNMNKIAFIIILLFKIALSSNAQDKKFKLVLITGMNASQVNGDKLGGFDKIGLLAGAGISREVSKKLGWQFEILYSEKGSKDVAGANNLQLDTLFKFNYIEIPILFNYDVYDKIQVQAGIYNAVRIKAEYDDYVNSFDRSNQIRALDHGLCIGVNYSITEHWKANFRVSQSVLDINNSFERYYNLNSTLSISYQL